MTKREELLALADRCEREEPSRELNAEIFCATAPSPFFFYGECVLAQQGGFAARVELDDIPKFTTSLDAAVTLVPEGAIWKLFSDWPGDAYFARVTIDGEPDREFAAANGAALKSPALALCAASLRARAAMERG